MTHVRFPFKVETRWVSGLNDAHAKLISQEYRNHTSQQAVRESLVTGLGIVRYRINEFNQTVLDAASIPLPYHSDDVEHWWSCEGSTSYVLRIICKRNMGLLEWLRGAVLPKQSIMISRTQPSASIFIVVDDDPQVAKCLENHGFLSCEPSEQLYRQWCEDTEYRATDKNWFHWKA